MFFIDVKYDGDSGEIRTDAWHGTSAHNAESIARVGFITKKGILGTGAYFDLETALSAENRARLRYPDEPKVILRCELHLGNVLNLNNPEVDSRFRAFQRHLNRMLGVEATKALGRGGQIDLFIDEFPIPIHSVLKRDHRGVLVVAMHDTRRIKVLSVEKLQEQEEGQ